MTSIFPKAILVSTAVMAVLLWLVSTPWEPTFWLIFVTTACIVHKLLQPKLNLAPMPHSWPVIGNLPNFPKDEQIAQFANRWAKEINSPVIRLRFGFTDAIVLNDQASLQEALVDRADDYAGRPYNTIFELISDGFQDVAFTDTSPEWRYKRRVMMAALRTFSVGEVFEERVARNFETIRELLDETLGTPINPSSHAKLLITNYQASVCFDKTFQINDSDFESFKESFDQGGKYFGKQLSVDIFKLLKYSPIEMPDYKEAKKSFEVIKRFTYKQVEQHIATFDPDNVRDFTDHLLKARAEAENEEKFKFSDRHLALMVNDIFAAGMATQQVMVTWFFHQLAMYPDVQQKAYDEIQDKIGSRQPTYRDRLRLPYCDATVQEIIRFATSTSIAVPRKTLVDTKVCGYDVPAGTVVFPNHCAVFMDPEFFPEPDQFIPERFIQNGAVVRPKAFTPFGAGRRQCAGETAARSTLFLIFIHLLQHYKIMAPENVIMKFEFDHGNTGPKPFKVIFEKRC